MRKIDQTTPDIKISYDFTLSKRQVIVNGHHAKHYKSSCRDLYIYKNIIIKIEDKWSYDHMCQCRNEVSLWKKIKVEDRKHFASILAYHIERSHNKTSWIAQQRCIPRKGRTSKKHRDTIYKIAEKYNLKDLEFFPPWNWTVTKEGIPVIFDYGL